MRGKLLLSVGRMVAQHETGTIGARFVYESRNCRSGWRGLQGSMFWQGKALGALIGGVTAGPVGALFGTFIGHLFDAQAESGFGGRQDNEEDDAAAAQMSGMGVQEAFF